MSCPTILTSATIYLQQGRQRGWIRNCKSVTWRRIFVNLKKINWFSIQQMTVLTMSPPITSFKTPVPIIVVAAASVRSLPRPIDNGYSCFEVSIDAFHERNTTNFSANITFQTNNPRFTKFSNSLTTSSNLYIHGILYLQESASMYYVMHLLLLYKAKTLTFWYILRHPDLDRC